MEFTKRERRRNHRCRQKEGLSLRLLLLRKWTWAAGPHEHWASDLNRKLTRIQKDCTLTDKNAHCMFSWMTHVHKHTKLKWQTIISFISWDLNSRWPSPQISGRGCGAPDLLRPNKTAFLWFDEPLSAEMRLSEGRHSLEHCTTHMQFTDPSTSHLQSLQAVLWVSVCVYICVCVHALEYTCGLVGLMPFPLCRPYFHFLLENPSRRRQSFWASSLCWWLCIKNNCTHKCFWQLPQ